MAKKNKSCPFQGGQLFLFSRGCFHKLATINCRIPRSLCDFSAIRTR